MLVPRMPTLPAEAPRLYLPGQAALMLGLPDAKTLATRAPKLRIRFAFTPGGHHRYYADDVDALVAGRGGAE